MIPAFAAPLVDFFKSMVMPLSDVKMIDRIKKQYGRRTADAVRDFFDNIGLPVPENDSEYILTADEGFLVFLNPAACVIRLTSEWWHPALQHPHVLQPLFARNCGRLRAEIFPGVLSPVKEEELSRLHISLEKDNIFFYDLVDANGGYVPAKSPEYPEGIPVIIDPGACIKLHAGVKWVTQFLRMVTNTPTVEPLEKPDQEEIYRPLRQAFAQAWPDNAPQSDRSKLKEAWTLCAQKKSEGLLFDNWNHDSLYEFYKGIQQGGERYAAAWNFSG